MGTWAGNAEKDTPPQAVEWGGAGKRAGGPRFRGPICPVTNSIHILCRGDILVKKVEQVYLALSFMIGSCTKCCCSWII